MDTVIRTWDQYKNQCNRQKKKEIKDHLFVIFHPDICTIHLENIYCLKLTLDSVLSYK